jgi:hypothetical protein
MWAIQLRTVISTKLQGGVLALEEPLRCDEFTGNNHKMFKYIKQLQVLQERRTGGQSILFTNVAYIFQEIEKTHINRVKDIMIAALNQEAILLQRVPNQDPVDLACGEQILVPPSQQMAQQNHLSTINEDDTSYCSEMRTPAAPKGLPGKTSLNPPYLPRGITDRKYTLVLDLDETLIHYVEES